MGREIRLVPPNWEHPKDENGDYLPLHGKSFKDAAAEWKADFQAWERGERPDYCTKEEDRSLEYWEWNGPPPDRKNYVDYGGAECTWFQVYETVSEGTPVTPPFATREELIDHLVLFGDARQQKLWKRGYRFMQPSPPGYSIEAAEALVTGMWAPSFVVYKNESTTEFVDGVESLAERQ